jgi:uncharacterized protein (TIGR02466 family)
MDRQFTEDELDFANFNKTSTYQNSGNVTSSEKYILNHPRMVEIKMFIDNAVQLYVDEVIKPKNEVQFYVTQSWFNYTTPFGHHHAHNHGNSIISGVLYFNADKNFDNITFFNPRKERIVFAHKEFTQYNSNSWMMPANTGTLYLFPSDLFHEVSLKMGENERISLAFNVFAKGYLGEEDQLTALHL